MRPTSNILLLEDAEIRSPEPSWDRETLLRQQGIFFLRDILNILDLEEIHIATIVRGQEKAGRDPWSTVGVRRIWNTWHVQMPAFALYYKRHIQPPYAQVPGEWDANAVIAAAGVYRLADICCLIPYTEHQIKAAIRSFDDPRNESGVWFEHAADVWLVDLEQFGPWLEQAWKKLKGRA